MTATTIIDFRDALPPDGGGHSADDKLNVASGTATAEVPTKAKMKRQRPTFDDGAVTRVFKFPSKTYPKSTYYVTSTEIIIRIKKARKKWKLVVPKKRIVSYRTNRWFAKPRWVEIELTFTQAARIGLVEPRTPSKEVPKDTTAEPLLVSPPVVENDHTFADDAASDAALEITSISHSDPEPDPEDGNLEHFTGADALTEVPEISHLIEESDYSHAEATTFPDAESTSACPSSLEFEGEIQCPVEIIDSAVAFDCDHSDEPHSPVRPVFHPLSANRESLPLYSPPSGECSSPSISDVPSYSPRNIKPSSKTRAYLMVATLALVLTSAAPDWVIISFFAPTRTIESTAACEQSKPAASCTQTIVTGAIDTGGGLQSTEPSTQTTSQTQASLEPLAVTALLEISVPEEFKTAFMPAESQPELPEAKALTKQTNEPPPPKNAGIEPESAVATTPGPLNIQQDLPARRQDCRELIVDVQSINIQFDYASSGLHHTILVLLDAFAEKLKSCPSVTVSIEGHTDSDGHPDRNKALSIRRAQSVRDRLVGAGANPDQLSVIGFGQTRPNAANVSYENKRINRRVVLAVESFREVCT